MLRILIYILLCVLCSCVGHRDQHLEYALKQAGENRAELEKVLAHYEGEPLKRQAVEFLISHMPGAYAVDPELAATCQPFYEMYDSLSRKYNNGTSTEWGKQVDSLWLDFSLRRDVSMRLCSDLSALSSDYLIGEIERAFRAWKGNVYARNCSFSDFCEYILPYRRQNGLAADNAREDFYKRHHESFFSETGKDCIDECDSLLHYYRHMTHSRFWGSGIPVYDARTLEKLSHGLCSHRCWYNSLLFSSLGMPVAIDFVPAWGNRNSSHTWNVLVLKDKIYPFESFWEEDRWKYKRIYNNVDIDYDWGKFRLPKVYRQTYSNHVEGPLADKDVDINDVPSLFRNSKKKDVSSQYFDTEDVTVTLTEAAPEGARYAYLCVFGNQSWHPVQWGRIEEGEVTFKGMGKDIVYLPMYCKNGQMVQAGDVFWLKPDGKLTALENAGHNATETIMLRIITGVAFYDRGTKYVDCMAGTTLWGVKDGKIEEQLCSPLGRLPFGRVHMAVKTQNRYRIVRLQLPSDSVALGDIAFCSRLGKIEGVKVVSPLRACDHREAEEMLTDGVDATAFRGRTAKHYVDIDLGQEYALTEISVFPYLQTQLSDSDLFELFYWKNGWKSMGRKRGTGGYLTFDRIPEGVLLMLKNCSWKSMSAERIFFYKAGEVLWN